MGLARGLVCKAALLLVLVLLAQSHAGTIRIGFMGPYNDPADPSSSSCPSCAAAFVAAVETLNERSAELLGGHIIEGVMLDSSDVANGSKRRALAHADQLMRDAADSWPLSRDDYASCYAELARSDVVAVVADLTSSTAELTALSAETHSTPMVGYGCTSQALSNRVKFPFFSRVVASDSYQAPYMAKMVKAFGWNHVAVIHGSESYGKGFAASFAAQCPDENVTVTSMHEFTSFTSTHDQLRAPLERIKDSGIRLILLAATGIDAYAVIQAADAVGITGPGYTWLGPDGWMSPSNFEGEKADAWNIMHGALGLFPPTQPDSSSAVLYRERVLDNQTYWSSRSAAYDPSWTPPMLSSAPLNKWGYYAWDATWLVARAAAGVATTDPECLRNGTCIQAAIRGYELEGATGSITLGPDTGERAGAYDIVNVRNGSAHVFVDVGTIVAGVVAIDRGAIVWADGTVRDDAPPALGPGYHLHGQRCPTPTGSSEAPTDDQLVIDSTGALTFDVCLSPAEESNIYDPESTSVNDTGAWKQDLGSGFFVVDVTSCPKFHFGCLDGDRFSNSTLWGRATSFIARRAEISTMKGTVFIGMSRIEVLRIDNNEITQLARTVLSPLAQLREINLHRNRLSRIDGGVFAAQSQLRRLVLSNNVITLIETTGFAGLSRLEMLILASNRLLAIPPALLLNGTRALTTLDLQQNLITIVSDGELDGLANLIHVDFSSNPVIKMDDTIFLSLAAMGEAPAAFAQSHTSPLGIPFDGVSSTSAPGGRGGRVLGLTALGLRPMPQACRWVGPGLHNVSCDTCHIGYDMNPNTSVCERPPFGPVRTWDLENTTIARFKESADYNGGALQIAQTYQLGNPSLTPRKTQFAGYSAMDYLGIKFELEFDSPVDIGCNRTVAIDTTGDEIDMIATHEWDIYRASALGLQDRPHRLRFNVIQAGTFGFDSCDSAVATSLMIFKSTENSTAPEDILERNPGGHSRCPCWSGAATLMDAQAARTNGTFMFANVPYPRTYGMNCTDHDAVLAPFCADADGIPLINPPVWCANQWCWVDPDNCDIGGTTESSYWSGSGLMFNYHTCGAGDDWVNWVAGTGNEFGLRIHREALVGAEIVDGGHDIWPNDTLARQYWDPVDEYKLGGTPVPWTGGCALGGSAKRTIELTEGSYYIMTRGHPLADDIEGQRVVSMTCTHGAESVVRNVADPGGFNVDPDTGEVTGSPKRVGDGYTMRLVAKDSSGAKALIATWEFNVTESTFRIQPDWNTTHLSVPRGIKDKYHINELHDLSGPGVLNEALFSDPAYGRWGEIFYALQIQRHLAEPPCKESDSKTLTDVATGDGAFKRSCPGTYFAKLIARDGAGKMAEVDVWTFTADERDTNVVAYGPNGIGCGGYGDAVDEVEMDQRFTCDCDAGWSGKNCETEDVEPRSSSDDLPNSDTTAVGVALGAVVFVTLVALTAFRIQSYRFKHRPMDVRGMQTEVMESLGLAAFDIKPTEFGINLAFDAAIDDVEVEGDVFRTQLVEVLRQAAPKLSSALRTARIAKHAISGTSGVDWAPGQGSSSTHVMVVASQRDVPSGIAEATVHAIARKAAKGKQLVGRHRLVDSSVAVPRRVPREVDRACLTRITELGGGAFGDVHLYQLKERDRGMPTYSVAAKSIRAGGADTADVRMALLREAALGALLDHCNVVATVGICTTPRDVPALLLLAFCSEGTLEEHVNVATPESMSLTERLTYCAQCLQGLMYISTRRIIHRDVSARNVLLDSTMTCKISDFGMATALADGGKEYVRSNEQLALRWCSTEVIREGKYSVQSDIWAFGVLAYEVFACGVVPYDDQFDNLTEVSSFIKEGGKLSRPNPEACPAEIYEELMLPCFATNPADRPPFRELYEVAASHGAEEDDEALAERAARKKVTSAAPAELSAAAGSGRRSNMLGPSVHHLKQTLVPAVQKAVQDIKKTGGHPLQSTFDNLDPAEASMWHTVKVYAAPISAKTLCPRDGITQGCAYVDTLAHEDDVAIATALLSYSWSYLVAEISAALSTWAERTKQDPKRTSIWICALCLNQHSLSKAAASPEALAKEFGERVVAIGRILPMLEPWHDPGYVKRAWCLFELFTAIGKRSIEIDIILSPRQAESFRKRINEDGSDAQAVDDALANVRSEDATATIKADLESIQALIQRLPGGFSKLDSTVKQYLRRWFVSQGGVRVVSRSASLRRMSMRGSTSMDGRSSSGASMWRRASAAVVTSPSSSQDSLGSSWAERRTSSLGSRRSTDPNSRRRASFAAPVPADGVLVPIRQSLLRQVMSPPAPTNELVGIDTVVDMRAESSKGQDGIYNPDEVKAFERHQSDSPPYPGYEPLEATVDPIMKQVPQHPTIVLLTGETHV